MLIQTIIVPPTVVIMAETLETTPNIATSFNDEFAAASPPYKALKQEKEIHAAKKIAE